jgi:hypothetical protein
VPYLSAHYPSFNKFAKDLRRLGYVGHSYGASYGGTIAGIEQRIAAYVLMAGWYSVSESMRTSLNPVLVEQREFAKCEKYCREQRGLLRAIEDLAQQEREMYELDAPFGSDYDDLQDGSGKCGNMGSRSLFSGLLCECELAPLASFLSVTWTDPLGNGKG